MPTLRRLLGLDRSPRPVQCDVCRHPAYYPDATPKLCFRCLNDWFDARSGTTTVEEYPVTVLTQPTRRRRRS